MARFYFPDAQPLDLEKVQKINNHFEKDRAIFNDLENKSEVNLKNGFLVKSELTVYLEDTLLFMTNNNLIASLPSIINIKYINSSTKEILFSKFKDLFGFKPQYYNYPASTNIYNGTIYVSHHYQEDDYSDSTINKIRMQFTSNIQQAVEYSFFHEIGHLFLIEKTKDKTNTQNDSFLKALTLNIEEGFAESFSIHMMCLKYPELPMQTNNFKNFDTRTLLLSNNLSKKFYLKKTDQLKLPLTDIIKQMIKNPTIKLDEMFNPYEFPLIYKLSPFKDNSGNLITNMDIIFAKCFDTALANNKAVILSKNSNQFTQQFETELLDKLQSSTQDFSNQFEQLITNFHTRVKNDGFVNMKIKIVPSFRGSDKK